MDHSHKLLVLDLDETLVHASVHPHGREADMCYGPYQVLFRPGLEAFLRTVAAHYTLGVWSSASDDYVKALVAGIFPEDVQPAFVWGRSRCTPRRDLASDEYVWEKHLRKLKKYGFPLEQILVVDDSPEKARNNYGNALYIREFTGDPADDELSRLAAYLLTLKDAANVRIVEKRGWRE